MSKLTYKTIYTPELDDGYGAEEKDINFLCADGKIHIRLRDYDHEEVIHGFIDKLTYLVTYLMKFTESKYVNTKDIIFKYFISGNHIQQLNKYIESTLHDIYFKGILVSKNYRKIKNYDVLGSFSEGTCPLDYFESKDLTFFGDLSFFLKKLGNISLYTYLFNDAYEIVICKEKKSKDSYKKFVNKSHRKLVKPKLEYVPLF